MPVKILKLINIITSYFYNILILCLYTALSRWLNTVRVGLRRFHVHGSGFNRQVRPSNPTIRFPVIAQHSKGAYYFHSVIGLVVNVC